MKNGRMLSLCITTIIISIIAICVIISSRCSSCYISNICVILSYTYIYIYIYVMLIIYV